MILFTKKQTYFQIIFFRFCESTVEIETTNHYCRNNWQKSSMAMESDMAEEMLHDLETRNFHVKQLIVDNDSTTFAKAKSSFDPNIKKISDFIHTKKKTLQVNFMIQKTEKVSSIRPKIYLTSFKCFAYAVKSNSDTTTLQKN